MLIGSEVAWPKRACTNVVQLAPARATSSLYACTHVHHHCSQFGLLRCLTMIDFTRSNRDNNGCVTAQAAWTVPYVMSTVNATLAFRYH